ncbi:MAG: hypothetical protein V3T30_02460, partial [Thermodesulfobacteriota bacterium]
GTATTLGLTSNSTARAFASNRLIAGADSYFGGRLTVVGDISATASANAVGSDHEMGSAYVGLFANGLDSTYLSVTGADPISYAPSSADPSRAFLQQMVSGTDTFGSGSQYYAEIEIINTISGLFADIMLGRITNTLEENDEQPQNPYYPGRQPFDVDKSGWVSWAGGIGSTPPPTTGGVPPVCDRVVNGKCLPPGR